MTPHLYIFQYVEDPGNSSIGYSNDSSIEVIAEDPIAWCRPDEEGWVGLQVAFFVTSYAFPMVLIILLYIGMLRRLWNPGSIGNKISKESLRNKRRVTR